MSPLHIPVMTMLSKLHEQISEFSLQINELKTRQFSLHQQLKPRSRRNSINRRINREHICYYHSSSETRVLNAANFTMGLTRPTFSHMETRVFKRLNDISLCINIARSVFGTSKIKYLGSEISSFHSKKA
ncbi:hypothetical protein CDAR_410301 [Caerostris darwini]|uniref:Uncharacterized protein n=1 Tax=Caerostris darwini TaxID=1538125 RepID=A0AAV4R8U4_9ARAC|nr:hypothetical protein CDAR_410301 [Caerostris darwini]